MNQNKMMSASMMMNSEIKNLEMDLDVATKSLGICVLDENAEWSVQNKRRIKCKVIEGQIAILKKMMNQISEMNIELPQLTNA